MSHYDETGTVFYEEDEMGPNAQRFWRELKTLCWEHDVTLCYDEFRGRFQIENGFKESIMDNTDVVEAVYPEGRK